MRRLTLTLLAGAALVAAPARAGAQNAAAVAEGARAWANNCTRCHSARSPGERSDEQWETIVLHMRARANLTRSQGRALIAFLQATNVPPPGVVANSAAQAPRQQPASEARTVRPPEDGGEPQRGTPPPFALAIPEGDGLSPAQAAALLRYLLALGTP